LAYVLPKGEKHRKQVENMEDEKAAFLDSKALEKLTGIKSSTWRYWAGIGEGPHSFRLGRRRVWRRSTVEKWLADQEASA
jgi:prophage regulatory protein